MFAEMALNLNFWESCGLYVTNLSIICIMHHFYIYTDNNPINYIMSTGKLTATGQWWVNKLVEFYFSLQYKLCKQNIIADALSCVSEQTSLEHTHLCTETLPVGIVKTLSESSDWTQGNQEPVAVSLNIAFIREKTNILNQFTTASKCFSFDDINKIRE